MVSLTFFVVLVLIDAYLKFLYFKQHPDEAADISGDNMFIGADILPLYSDYIHAQFSFVGSVRWGVLLPFMIMILLVLTWLLYYSINDDVLARKKVVYAEVRPKEEDISRTQSKINLKVLLETNKMYKSSNPFNKIWYEQRDKQGHVDPLEGFVFDGQGMVANSFNFKSNVESIQEMQNVFEQQKHGQQNSIGQILMPIAEENEGQSLGPKISARGRKQSVMYKDSIRPPDAGNTGNFLNILNKMNPNAVKNKRSASVVSFGGSSVGSRNSGS